jgi:hypothetical protein
MKGMSPDETASYIRHHLEQAGRTTELFNDDAITRIHQAARGKPRTVNNICTAALIATAGAGKNLVDSSWTSGNTLSLTSGRTVGMWGQPARSECGCHYWPPSCQYPSGFALALGP